MPIDIRKIDGQIRKLQEIRRLLSDPDAVRLLEHAIIQRPRIYVPPRANANTHQMPQSRAVWRCIVGMPGTFTVPDVAKSLKSSGIQIRNSTVSRIMSDLIRRDRIRVVERGSGRRPNVCERVPLQ